MVVENSIELTDLCQKRDLYKNILRHLWSIPTRVEILQKLREVEAEIEDITR